MTRARTRSGVLAAALTAASAFTALVAQPAAADTSSSPSSGPAGPDTSTCGWRFSAEQLYQELAGAHTTQAVELRALLQQSGVGQPDFLPQQCQSGANGPGPTGTGPDGQTGAGAGETGPGAPAPTEATAPTAAAAYHWGAPDSGLSDEFDSTNSDTWDFYDSAGNGGNGLRRPTQDTVHNNYLQITGLPDGTTGGMMSRTVQTAYGRWEARMRVDTQGEGGAYHPVIALVPYGVAYAGGAGDLDLAETDSGSGEVNIFIHYPSRKQDYVTVKLDLSQWHTYGLEIAPATSPDSPAHITWFIDGNAVMTDTNPDAVTGTRWTKNLQLDANQADGQARSDQQVDYFRYYPLPPGGAPLIAAPAPETGAYH